jgi:hypothetical protein
MRSLDRDRRRIPNGLAIVGGLVVVSPLMWLVARSADAAAITWNAPLTVTSPTDIMLPAGGTIHFAADFNTTAGFDPTPDDDDMINGIPFTRVDAAGIPGLLTHTFNSGPNFGAAAFPGGTGDADLDNLLNSHSWMAGNPVTATVTLQGLTVGAPYQVQVIGAVDTRACCAARVYEPDNGQGQFSAGVSIQRGLTQSIIGTFVADGSTQTFQWRSQNSAAGNNDPGMSGLVVTRRPGSVTGVVAATLNRDTGNLTVSNGTIQPLDIIGYNVRSDFGGLNPANWTTIANNFDKPSAPTPGNGSIDSDDAWTNLSGTNHNLLSEAELNVSGPRNGGAIAAGQAFNLGNVWIKSPTEDVVIEVLRTNGQIHTVGLAYTGNGGQAFRFADLNFDNVINPADWNIYIAGALTNVSALSGAERYQKGDLNNDGVNNLNDTKLFLDAYDAANGAGSFAAMLASLNVPEPSAAFLLLAGGVLMAASRRRILGRSCSLTSYLAVALVAMCMSTQDAVAAPIIWDEPFPIQTPADVIALPGGTIHFAADFNTATDFGPQDDMINGILFTQVGAAGLPGLLTHTFANGPNFGAAAFPGGTGDPDLDNLMNSHSWHAGNPQTAMVTIDGLTIGASYTIQVIGAADTRACCSARAYEPDDGQGNFTTGISYTRGDLASIVGTFTADSATQIFQWRSLNGAVDNNDPSMSALVVTQGQSTGPITLDLEVNTVTGQATLRNETAGAFEIRGYEVTSAGGSLSPAGWTVPTGWTKAGGASSTALLAGALEEPNFAMLAMGGSLPFGNAYNTTVNVQDLALRFLTAEGTLRPGTVSYISEPGGVFGDYNGNGTVDAADYVAWRNALNTNTTLPNDSTPGTVTPEDYTVWRANFGRTGGAAAAVAGSATVPEPSSLMFVLSACLVLCARRQRAMGSASVVSRRASALLTAALLVIVTAQMAQANSYVDRRYSFGDDATEDAGNAVAGVVGSGPANVNPGATLDSAGVDTVNFSDFQDLDQNGSATYINVSVTGPNLAQPRPGAAPGSRGIRFDGVDDYLRGARLNFPETATSSTGSLVQPPGPLNYSGISNRGFQLWVYPTGPNPGTVQSVVSDLNQHGARINAAGNWEMRYNGAITNSNRAATFNQWSHVMVVRPFGVGTPTGGSILYLNGEAIAAAAGDYNAAPTPNDFLVVGGEPADANQVVDAEFFRGVVDDMNMFVLGTVTTGPNPAPGTYNFEFGKDNTYATLPVGISGLSGVAGDVNQDGQVNAADIDAMVAGWGKEKRVNNVRVGDKLTVRDGDLNFDGITDLADVFRLHTALLAGTGTGFDFSRLPGSVPEPSTLLLGTVLLAASATRRCRKDARTL